MSRAAKNPGPSPDTAAAAGSEGVAAAHGDAAERGVRERPARRAAAPAPGAGLEAGALHARHRA